MNHLERSKRCHSIEAADSNMMGGRKIWSLHKIRATPHNRQLQIDDQLAERNTVRQTISWKLTSGEDPYFLAP